MQKASIALVFQGSVGHLPDLPRLQGRSNNVPSPLLSEALVDSETSTYLVLVRRLAQELRKR